jgi:non-canonical purine NTP pyrophosphatase (RdgB/HAM1 family)
MTEIIIGTSNEGKIEEIMAALPGAGIKWLTAKDFADWPEIDETEPTFEGNARKKAVTLAGYLGKLALADDSGLEVDALGGRPGVLSARFSDPGSTVERNNAKLLAELADLPYEQRTAHFSCVIALAEPNGDVVTTEGSVAGHIVMHPSGDKGFGYDPLFIPVGFDRTMAELDLAEKNKISHRGQALRRMADVIAQRLS